MIVLLVYINVSILFEATLSIQSNLNIYIASTLHFLMGHGAKTTIRGMTALQLL